MKKICILVIGASLILTACGSRGVENIDVNNDLNVDEFQNMSEYKLNESDVNPSFVGVVEKNSLIRVKRADVVDKGYFKDGDLVDIGDTGDMLYMEGTNVKVTYNDFVFETYPAQIVPISIDLLNNQAGYVKLEDLPKDYTMKAAIEDGCVVMTFDKTYNNSVLESFLNDYENNDSSFVRTVNFTIEGDMIITDVKYIKRDNKFYVRRDNTRDEFAEDSDRVIRDLEYTNLIKETRDNFENIYLDNQKNVPDGQSAPFTFSSNAICIASYNRLESEIDELLNTIVSSPATSSNPEDYIEAHPEEYNKLIAMDTAGLEILFSKLSNDNTGLTQWICLSAVRNILGGEDIKLAVNTPHEYYEEYRGYLSRLVKTNSREYVELNFPKAKVLLEK